MCLYVWLGFLKMIVGLLSHSGHQESLLGGHSTMLRLPLETVKCVS